MRSEVHHVSQRLVGSFRVEIKLRLNRAAEVEAASVTKHVVSATSGNYRFRRFKVTEYVAGISQQECLHYDRISASSELHVPATGCFAVDVVESLLRNEKSTVSPEQAICLCHHRTRIPFMSE